MGGCGSRADGDGEYRDGNAQRSDAEERRGEADAPPLPDVPSRERGIGDITEDQEMTVGVCSGDRDMIRKVEGKRERERGGKRERER
jgi:hypothetical protein